MSAGKWAIIDTRGQPGKATVFPPAKIEPGERISYMNTLRVTQANGAAVNEIADVANKQNRATATITDVGVYLKVEIEAIADSPEMAQLLVDRLLTRMNLRYYSLL